MNPATLGVRKILEKRKKSAVARKLTGWLHYAYLMGGGQGFKAGDKINSTPQVGRGFVTLPPRRSAKLQSRGEN